MKTVLIQVDEHPEVPDGCFMKFSALGEVRPVSRIRWESPDGSADTCIVMGREEDGRLVPAWTVPVDDSGSGQCWLVGGGVWGVEVRASSGQMWVEPYLLLSPDSVID